MEKLNLETKNLAQDKFKKLAELFPNAITETIVGKDEEGNDIIDSAIDADVLRQEISELRSCPKQLIVQTKILASLLYQN